VSQAAAAALYFTDRAGVQPTGSRLSPRPRDYDLRRTAIRSPGLLFNGLDSRNPCMDYYSFTDPGGMECCVGLIG